MSRKVEAGEVAPQPILPTEGTIFSRTPVVESKPAQTDSGQAYLDRMKQAGFDNTTIDRFIRGEGS